MLHLTEAAMWGGLVDAPDRGRLGCRADRHRPATIGKRLRMTLKSGISRRGALKLGAAATALPLVHIRTAGAAGKLTIAFWDHWVPAGNDVMRKQVQAWADKNKVDVQPDFVTSNGFKNLVTIAAEAQAKQGHDIQALPGWETQNHRELLEPMDDV